MPIGLKRIQTRGDLHFITFSCYHRNPYLGQPAARNLFERSLEAMRNRYQFAVIGYVVMPEHVHLLLSEPKNHKLATALQALKLSVSVQSEQRPYWQKRYYDFNVFTEDKRVEKLRYLHRNPVKRGLVAHPQDWPWSSFLHYATAQRFTVEIASEATAAQRERLAAQTHVSQARHGAPTPTRVSDYSSQ